MKILNLVLVSLTFFSVQSFAGESGVIFQGKKTVLYKDGKKVGELPAGFADNKPEGRKPDSVKPPIEGVPFMSELYFQEIGDVVCYSLIHDTRGPNPSLSCVKK